MGIAVEIGAVVATTDDLADGRAGASRQHPASEPAALPHPRSQKLRHSDSPLRPPGRCGLSPAMRDIYKRAMDVKIACLPLRRKNAESVITLALALVAAGDVARGAFSGADHEDLSRPASAFGATAPRLSSARRLRAGRDETEAAQRQLEAFSGGGTDVLRL
ncbi:MAG: hypothetical protein WD969_04885 [Paracoccaceae bacterium]